MYFKVEKKKKNFTKIMYTNTLYIFFYNNTYSYFFFLKNIVFF